MKYLLFFHMDMLIHDLYPLGNNAHQRKDLRSVAAKPTRLDRSPFGASDDSVRPPTARFVDGAVDVAQDELVKAGVSTRGGW